MLKLTALDFETLVYLWNLIPIRVKIKIEKFIYTSEEAVCYFNCEGAEQQLEREVMIRVKVRVRISIRDRVALG